MNSPDRKLSRSFRFGEKSVADSDEGVDRISDLPDEILCKILRLLPTNCAVRTAVLSTRWKDLFSLTSDLNLDFDDDPLYLVYLKQNVTEYEMRTSKFINFIYRCFRVLRGNVKDINQFKFCGRLWFDSQGDHLANWIHSALHFNVKEIDVVIIEDGYCYEIGERVPILIPPSETITVLKLAGPLDVGFRDSVGLPNLKVLHLDCVHIEDENLNRIFKKCHMLEEVVLYSVLEEVDLDSLYLDSLEIVIVLDISGPALKRVSMDSVFVAHAAEIHLVLDAPSVEYFYFGDYPPTSISANLPSLVEAHIFLCGYSNDDGEIVVSTLTRLVEVCRQVSVLTLGGYTLELLQVILDMDYVFHNLKHLVLGRLFSSFEWALFSNLLENSPNLETLVFEKSFSKLNFGGSAPMPHVIPSCVSSHVTSIGIKEFEGEECELKCVEYFLAGAEVLQNMRIRTNMRSDKLFELSEKLLNLPRSSKECRVMVT